VARAARMIDGAAAGTVAVAALATGPLGTLRVNTPTAFGEPFITPYCHTPREEPRTARRADSESELSARAFKIGGRPHRAHAARCAQPQAHWLAIEI